MSLLETSLSCWRTSVLIQAIKLRPQLVGGTACWNCFFVGLNHSLSMKNSIFVHSYLCCLKQNVKIQCKAQAKTLRKAFLQHINCFYLVLCLCRLISDFVRKLKKCLTTYSLALCVCEDFYTCSSVHNAKNSNSNGPISSQTAYAFQG